MQFGGMYFFRFLEETENCVSSVFPFTDTNRLIVGCFHFLRSKHHSLKSSKQVAGLSLSALGLPQDVAVEEHFVAGAEPATPSPHR